jgi:hypothetical protein
MKTLNFRRWSNTIAAIILTVLFGYFFGSLSVWKDKQSEVAYPAEEFGQVVTYQEGFWLEGSLLFIAVTATAGLLSLAVRRLIITVDGYDKPKGSLQLRIWGYTITGFGVAFSSLNPFLGPLVFIAGLACLVVSIQQKCPDHSHLLES